MKEPVVIWEKLCFPVISEKITLKYWGKSQIAKLDKAKNLKCFPKCVFEGLGIERAIILALLLWGSWNKNFP